MEQNAHLPEEEQEEMRRDLARFKSFFYETESNHSFLANMVEQRPGIEFGFTNFRLRRSILEADDEPRQEEYEEAPELIASQRRLDDYPDLTSSLNV